MGHKNIFNIQTPTPTQNAQGQSAGVNASGTNETATGAKGPSLFNKLGNTDTNLSVSNEPTAKQGPLELLAKFFANRVMASGIMGNLPTTSTQDTQTTNITNASNPTDTASSITINTTDKSDTQAQNTQEATEREELTMLKQKQKLNTSV